MISESPSVNPDPVHIAIAPAVPLPPRPAPVPAQFPAVVQTLSPLNCRLVPVKLAGAFKRATLLLNRASLTVPAVRAVAFKSVSCDALSAGSWPLALRRTRPLAALTILPCRVTFELRRVSLSVPVVTLVALRPVKPAPLPARLFATTSPLIVIVVPD